MIAWVTRNTISREKSVMLHIYKTIIRPHLENCVQVWSPKAEQGNWGTIMEIEGVQRTFTRMIDGIGLLPYSQRLEELHLTTLAERRVRGDLIETFKIMNNVVSYCPNIFEIGYSGLNLLSKPVNCSNNSINKCLNSYLSRRIHKYWNKLPLYCKNATSVDLFKISLSQFKESNIDIIDSGNFCEISDNLLDKLEGASYLKNKESHNMFLINNPGVARRRGINISN